STAGLERLDLVVPNLSDYVDVLMGTRGALRACVPPDIRKGIALRVSSGSSMLNDDLSHEVLAVDIQDAIRMNADCMAVQVFIGADGQLASIDNLSRCINAGLSYSIPTMGVVAVGKDMERTDSYFKLATRIIAEMGVNIIKTYYCDNFEEVVAACPVPIVVAGGKKLPEQEALQMAYLSIQHGANGVDMGRNIFQSYHATAMAAAIGKIVHEKFTDKQAYEFYLDTINEKK
ncbi:MAG TPA: 3-hydroxy-5-phosphonooxypentane-2,4-dione thiolase, partial [Flexilinea sp.]|nr:3-hydroxy-5-phosphonooxypentane-2,4-dione thiolase [Flexilinea sp.]